MAIKNPPKLLTTAEWYELIYQRHGSGWGLVALEQAMYQSEHRKVCIECLTPDNLIHQTNRTLIKSTDYYMCQDCLDYYNNKR